MVKERISVSTLVGLLKIGLIEALYALNFSNFSYHKVILNPYFSYLIIIPATIIFYFALTFFEKKVKEIKNKRVFIVIFALVIQVISISITTFCGFGDKLKDISTIMSLFCSEILTDFIFGYSLCYFDMINF